MDPKKEVNKKGHRRKPKNKNELESFSGVTKKKKVLVVDKKPKVDFIFEDLEGKRYTTADGRIKIDQQGGVSFLLKIEETWKTIKGHLVTIKVK